MQVTLAQLEALRSVARFRSFTTAARALGITQPAVSQHLAALQRSLGLTLVESVRNRPQLTDAGRFVAARAERVGRLLDALVRDVREYAHAERGELHVAATLTVGSYVLPQILANFCAAHPHVNPRVDIANTAAVAERVLAGEVSIGLLEGFADDPELILTPFMRDRMVLIAPAAGHPFSTRAHVSIADLAAIAFVSRERGSGTRDHGYDALRQRGIVPPIAVELPNGEAIVRAVEAGSGVALLSQFAVERALAHGSVHAVVIDDLTLERNFSVARVRERTLAPIAQAFVDLLHQDNDATFDRPSEEG